jgi:hypothetical protein
MEAKLRFAPRRESVVAKLLRPGRAWRPRAFPKQELGDERKNLLGFRGISLGYPNLIPPFKKGEIAPLISLPE